jgi:hypothetical protein
LFQFPNMPTWYSVYNQPQRAQSGSQNQSCADCRLICQNVRDRCYQRGGSMEDCAFLHDDCMLNLCYLETNACCPELPRQSCIEAGPIGNRQSAAHPGSRDSSCFECRLDCENARDQCSRDGYGIEICHRLHTDCVFNNCVVNGDCCSAARPLRNLPHQMTYQNF